MIPFSQHHDARCAPCPSSVTGAILSTYDRRVDPPGREGLDLGAPASVPGVRLRCPCGAVGRGQEPGVRERERLAPGARAAGRHATPTPQVWSPLEYACHVRDVHRVFGERVQMMLAVDDPLFE